MLYLENADGEMGGDPDGAEQQDDSENQFGGDSRGAREGRDNVGDF
jgi:hypothetical protein